MGKTDKFKEKLRQLMSGRYGMDALYNALMVVCFALIGANLFVDSPILSFSLWVVMSLAIYRSLSRNIARRRRENDAFLRLSKPVRHKASIAFRRVREIRTHRFRTCPGCKAVIEMPLRKGKRMINCPRCHTEFETRISF